MEAPSWLKKFSTSIKGKSKRSRSPTDDALSSAVQLNAAHSLIGENDDQLEYMGDSVLSAGAIQEAPRLSLKRPSNVKAKPLKEIMHSALGEGLEKPLDQSNLGFKMLSKMGFREGSGLGKDGLGISEPISIGLGNGRLGLGVMEEKRRAAQDALQMQKQQERSLRESFLDNRKKTFEVTKVLRDLEKAQKACEELDVACGIESSEFWARTTDDEEPQKPDNVIEAAQRTFCDAAGATYAKADCPEPTPPPQDATSIAVRFRSVVEYMRERHHYCHYCTSRFASDTALEAYCRTDEDCAPLFDLD